MLKKGYVQCSLAYGPGFEPGNAISVDQSTGAPLPNKPCNDGWVEEGGGEESPHAP